MPPHRLVTKKLHYHRFTHSLMLDGDADDVLAWARQRFGKHMRQYRQRNHAGHTHTISIYCDRDAHDAIMEAWPSRVLAHCTPVDAHAEMLLRQRVTVDVRERLYFNRYRWSVRFWWDRRFPDEFVTWVRDTFGDDRKGYRYHRSRNFPLLYLSDENYVLLNLMALPCKIIGRVRCYTPAEVQAAIR